MPLRRPLAAIALAAALAAGCGGSTEGVLGAELYGQSCSSCHGDAGEGGIGPALDGGSNAAELTDEQIAGVIRVGPGTMPSFSRLSDEQVESLVDFIRTLQAP